MITTGEEDMEREEVVTNSVLEEKVLQLFILF